MCLFYLCIDFCLLFCTEDLIQLHCFPFFFGSCDDVTLFQCTARTDSLFRLCHFVAERTYLNNITFYKS